MNHRSFLFVFLFLFGSFSPLCSQSSEPEWTVYPAVSDIQDIAEDGDYLWLAGLGGLVKFNRTTFESEILTRVNSGLPSVDLSTVAVDKQGNLWVGTADRGVAVFDGVTWTVHSVASNFLASDHIWEIAVTSDSSVWISTAGGATRYRNGVPTIYDGENYPWLKWYIFTIVESTPGTVWFGSANGYGGPLDASFYRFENEEWADGRDILDQYPQVSSMAYYKGVLWLATRQCYSGTWVCSGSVVAYDGSTSRFYPSQGYYPVTVLTFDSSGTMWCAHYDYPGLLRYDSTFKKIPVHGENIPSRGIRTMMTDSDGILWIVSDNGVTRYNGTEWKSFNHFGNLYPASDHAHGFRSTTIMAIDTNQSIWLGYGNSLPIVHFTGTHWFHYPSSYPSYYTVALAIDKHGVKWSLTNAPGKIVPYLYKLEGNDWQLFDEREYTCLYIDRDNRLWAGINNGVAVYDGSNWTNYTTDNSDVPGPCFAVTQSPDGAMWFTTVEKLARFHHNKWESYPLPSTNERFMTLLVSDSAGNIWCSRPTPYSGVPLMQFNSTDWVVHTSFGDSLWLGKDDGISALTVDKTGKIWVAVHGGLGVFDGTHWKSYTYQNSPLHFPAVTSLAVDAHNNLWIGTATGLMTYREGGVVTSAPEQVSAQPGASLIQNNPNPASSLTTISYSLRTGAAQHVQLKIYNALGIEIVTLVDRVQQPSDYSVEFDTSTLPAGVYYYQLQTGNTTTSRQMVVVK